MRETADPVEQIGVQRAEQAAERAGLVLAIVDGSVPLTEEDMQALAHAKAAPRSVLVVNKCDKAEIPDGTGWIFLYSTDQCQTGQRTGRAARCTSEMRRMEGVAFDGGVITNARQADALRCAAECCGQALHAAQMGMTPDAVLMDVEGAIAALGELTGQSVREDIIADIFSRFWCRKIAPAGLFAVGVAQHAAGDRSP